MSVYFDNRFQNIGQFIFIFRLLQLFKWMAFFFYGRYHSSGCWYRILSFQAPPTGDSCLLDTLYLVSLIQTLTSDFRTFDKSQFIVPLCASLFRPFRSTPASRKKKNELGSETFWRIIQGQNHWTSVNIQSEKENSPLLTFMRGMHN